ncbi:GDSL Lipase/Acylhydrolase superfamily protein [Trifolium repens]|nr:GDSL Lipase/Acylhydrolase superfamily protein [Trifolium repens]
MAWSLQQQWLFTVLPLVFAISATSCYTSIFSFGDSLTDTGNLNFISSPQSPNCLLPPYGETHFHHPTGRCSDGRLIIDFIAEFFGLPYVKPYLGFKNGELEEHGNIEHGVNFAVAGAPALDRSFFEEKGFVVEVTANYSLMVQLDWFKELLPSLCNSSSSCKEVLGSSLFIVGEIGGNDYGFPLFDKNAFEELITYVPQVISVITSAIKELIDLGAVTILVPGSLPLGCNPAYLTMFATTNKEEYDQAGCLIWLNKFFEYHNEMLQIELNTLRGLYPSTNIIYADYFNAALQYYKFPEQYGFDRNAFKVCCGGGGPYNYNDTALCGNLDVIACDDPSKYVSWDGYHSTEAAHRWITKGILEGPYTIPKFSVSCLSSE